MFDNINIYNLQGDVTAIADESGDIVAKYQYDAWGKVLAVTNSYNMVQTSDTFIGNINPIRYRGYYYDRETGFYYLNSRYYDPETGRFINMDDTGVVTASPTVMTDKNLYSYCDNNPVMRKDNGGEFWDTIFDAISPVTSIVDVATNPTDPMAWAGLAADVACTLVPGLTGGGVIVKAVSKADDVVDVVKTAKKVTDKSIKYTDKVIKQMDNVKDLNHAFSPLVDTMVDMRKAKPLKGGDGIVRKVVELPGTINGKEGVFEYIFDPTGWCNHRFFKEFK